MKVEIVHGRMSRSEGVGVGVTMCLDKQRLRATTKKGVCGLLLIHHPTIRQTIEPWPQPCNHCNSTLDQVGWIDKVIQVNKCLLDRAG
jgi:hypothetical protein